jgi:hypothetical protein
MHLLVADETVQLEPEKSVELTAVTGAGRPLNDVGRLMEFSR